MADRTYTLFLLDGSDSPPAFEICICESAEAARLAAVKLLRERPRYNGVEVSDDRTSFTVQRGQV